MLDLSRATFRAHPAYRLLPLEHLPAEQQPALESLRDDPECFGVLVPREEGDQSLRSVCRSTALVWYALQAPGVLPQFAREFRDEGGRPSVVRLVLDGVLEIQAGDRFLSGIEAGPLFGLGGSQPERLQGAIARLSVEALRYAQGLALPDKAQLSARLYFFNRRPLRPDWARRLRDPQTVARYVAVEEATSAMALPASAWSEEPVRDAVQSWRVFRSSKAGGGRGRYHHKLYVSPTVEAMPEAVRAVVGMWAQGVETFKLGRDLHALFRPDKLVVYFTERDRLLEAAARLTERLAGMAAQPVPFTSELGGDGLLSCGRDPPPRIQPLQWQESESWRLWVTNRLASALADGCAASPGSGAEPWRYALERLELEGVDVATWTPRADLWARAEGGRS